MGSPYMHWAKTLQTARYTLAISGIKGLSLAELGATMDDLCWTVCRGTASRSCAPHSP